MCPNMLKNAEASPPANFFHSLYLTGATIRFSIQIEEEKGSFDFIVYGL